MGKGYDQGRTRSRALLRWVGVGIAFAAVLMVAMMLATLGRLYWEEIQWQPRDSRRLEVRAIHYSREGILLHVHAPSGIAEVWKQADERGLRGFLPVAQHRQVPFRVLPETSGEDLRLLVDYPFQPPYRGGIQAEWYLAIRSRDGYWVTMSPYFPERPDIGDEEWQGLRARAREVLPAGA